MTAWDNKSAGDEITSADYNTRTTEILRVSGLANDYSRISGLADVADIVNKSDGDVLTWINAQGNWSSQAVTASPAGSDTQVQFNDGGSTLGGDSDFTWNKTTNTLTIAGYISAQKISGVTTPLVLVSGLTNDEVRFTDISTRIYRNAGDDLVLESEDDVLINSDDDVDIQREGTSYARFGGNERGLYISKDGSVISPNYNLQVDGTISGNYILTNSISSQNVSGATIIGTFQGQQIQQGYLKSGTEYWLAYQLTDNSGNKYTLAYDWYNASSNKISDLIASGTKYTQTYDWMIASGNQYNNILDSGTKYTLAYTWFTESSSRISEYVHSGNEYSQAYASAQIAMYDIKHAGDIDDGAGGGWDSTAFNNSGIKWDGTNWVPMPSGGSGGAGGDTPGGTNAGDVQYRVDATTLGGETTFNYDSDTDTLRLYHVSSKSISSQTISGGTIIGNYQGKDINLDYIESGSQLFNILQSGTKYTNSYQSSQASKVHSYHDIISGQYIKDYIASSTARTQFLQSGNIYISLSSQNISGGTIQSYGMNTFYISATNSNITANMGGTLVSNLDGDSYTYGLNNMGFLSSQGISGGYWSGATIHSQYIMSSSKYAEGYSERGSQIAGDELSWDGSQLDVDDSFLRNDADDTTTGVITAGGLSTTGYVSSATISGGLYKNIAIPAEYTIMKDKGTYLVRSGRDGQVKHSTTSASSAANYALSRASGVTLLLDDMILDGRIITSTGSNKRQVLDLGGRTIFAGTYFESATGRDGAMITMNEGVTVRNGRIQVFDECDNFSGSTCILFDGSDKYWVQNNYTVLDNLDIRNNVNDPYHYSGGTAIYYLCDNTPVEAAHHAVYFTAGTNIKINGFKYGIRMFANRPHGLAAASSAIINGNIYTNLLMGYNWRFLDLQGYTSIGTGGVVNGHTNRNNVNGNAFYNCQFQVGTNTDRTIYCDGTNNTFKGFLAWDATVSNLSDTMVEFHVSSTQNFLETMDINTGTTPTLIIDSGSVSNSRNTILNTFTNNDTKWAGFNTRIIGVDILQALKPTAGTSDPTDLIYLDGTNSRVGIKDSTPDYDFDSPGSNYFGSISGESLILGENSKVTAILDEDNFASNSATALATQQSIKAYVDDGAATKSGPLAGNMGSDFTYGFSGLKFISSQSISGGSYKNIHLPSTYTVFKGTDGDYYARKGSDGSIVYSNSNASTVLNSCFSSLSTSDWTGSGTICLGTDITLDAEISGGRCVIFDLKGHTIRPNGDFNMFRLNDGSIVRNGVFDLRQNWPATTTRLFDHHACIIWSGQARNHQWPTPIVENIVFYGGSNDGQGDPLSSAGQSGSAVFIQLDSAKESGMGVSNFIFTNLHMHRMGYGIRAETLNSSNTINNVKVLNCNFEGCKYSLYLSGNINHHYLDSNNEIAGWMVQNCNWETNSNVKNHIFLGPNCQTNYIHGFVFDSSDSQNCVEFHASTNNNHLSINGGPYSYGKVRDYTSASNNNMVHTYTTNTYRFSRTNTSSVGGIIISGTYGDGQYQDARIELAHGMLISNANDTETWMYGGNNTADELFLRANTSDNYPLLKLVNNGDINARVDTGSDFIIEEQTTDIATFNQGGLTMNRGGISSSAMSGGTIKSYTLSGTHGGGLYAHFVSANNSNITASMGGTLTSNLDGDSNTYGVNNLDFVSSQSISGGTYKNIFFPATYIIYEVDNTYYARKGSDGSILTAGGSAGDVINYAFSSCGSQKDAASGDYYKGSGTVYLATDITLDKTISGAWYTTLDMGGHTIWPTGDFNALYLWGSMTVKNGVFNYGKLGNPSHDTAAIYLNASGAASNRAVYDLYNILPTIQNVGFIGGNWNDGNLPGATKSWASGTGIYLHNTSDISSHEILSLYLNNLHFTYLRHGIKAYNNSSAINAIRGDGLLFNACRYGIWLSGNNANEARTYKNISGWDFQNLLFQTTTSCTHRHIYVGPGARNDYFQGFVYDVSNAASSDGYLMEVHASANNCHFDFNQHVLTDDRFLDNGLDTVKVYRHIPNEEAIRYRCVDGIMVSGSYGQSQLKDFELVMPYGARFYNYPDGVGFVFGGDSATDDLRLCANNAIQGGYYYSWLELNGAGDIELHTSGSANDIIFYDGNNQTFKFDINSYPHGDTSIIEGQAATAKKLKIAANSTDSEPYIQLDGGSNITVQGTVNALSSQAISGGSFHHLYMPYDYAIFKLGDEYFAKRGRDGAIVSSCTTLADNIFAYVVNQMEDGGKLYLASGIYHITDTITIDKAISIEGAGVGRSVVPTTNPLTCIFANVGWNSTGYMMQYNNASEQLYAPYIKNINFDASSRTSVKGGIQLRNTTQAVIENVCLDDFYASTATDYPGSGIAILLVGTSGLGSYYNEIRNCRARRCTVGFMLSSNCNGNMIQGGMIGTSRTGTNYRRGIIIDGGDTNVVYGPCDIEDMDDDPKSIGVYITSSNGGRANRFFGLRTEGLGEAVRIANGSNCGSNSFVGCSFLTATVNDMETASNKSAFLLINGMPDKHTWNHISSNAISGAWTTPLYPSKPAAAAGNCGQLIRVSGGTGEKTYVFMSVKNDADAYEWMQLGVST